MPDYPILVKITESLVVGGVTVSGSATPQDALANPSSCLYVESMGMMWDGTSNWNRLRGTLANGLQVDVTRIQGSVAFSNGQAVLDSTTAALGAGAAYIGTAKNCSAYARLVGSVYADQAGTLYIEQSQDGANWDISQSIAVTASTPAGFTYEVLAPKCRMRYVNGAAAQGTFRLQMNGRNI